MADGIENKIICPVCGSEDVTRAGNIGICFSCRAKFELLEAEEKPFKPLRLFLSYGHPEAEICRRIVAALRGRGHKVWMDEDKIHTGDDWRRRIMQGVSESQGVVSCLSRHSVRDPGVCLDELSIAIGVSGGNIKTVLLEPERLVEPPPSLCHLQWLDMSEWKQKLSEGEAVFEPWFKGKMEELIRVIESPDSQEFAGQIAELKKKLYVNYSTGKQRDLLSRLFVGRGWLTQEVEDWLNDPNGNRLCVLYGDPGVGKSAFAAHYIHYNPRVAAGLFCEFSHPHYNESRTLLMTLAYLLACRIPDYRSALIASLEHEKRLGSMEPSELFDLLFTGPMGRLMVDGSRETLCVVIDGLDECSSGESNTVAQVLGQFAPRLPKWLRILVTAREVASVQEPLGGAHHLELHGAEARNLSDVEEYFKAILGERFGSDPEWGDALTALRERSGGIFLYAQLVAEGILSGKLTLRDTSSFPSGMSDAFHRWFTWFFPDVEEYKREWRPAFDLLLASSEPLPKDELRNVLHWSDGKRKDFLRRVKVLLREGKNDWGKETVELTHLYLRQWLSSSGMYSASAVDGAEAMEREYLATLRADPDKLSEYGALYLASVPDIDQRLTDDERHDLVWRCLLAGDYCATWGKYASAERALRLAVARSEVGVRDRDAARVRRAPRFLFRTKSAEDKRVSRALRYYGISCNKLATVLEAIGDLDGALELYERGLTAAQRVAEGSDGPGALKTLANSYANVAEIHRARGDLDGAQELYGKALAVCEDLSREFDSPEMLSGVSACCVNVALILETRGDFDGALKLYRRALAIDEESIKADRSPGIRKELGISCNSVARILETRGDLAGAMKLYKRALALFEELAQEERTPEICRELGVSCNNVAGILETQGDLAGAMELYKRALHIRRKLAQELGTPAARRELSINYSKIASVLMVEGDLQRAMELYRRALDIQEDISKGNSSPSARRDIIISCGRVARILEVQGDLDGALKLYERCLKLSEELAEKFDTPDILRDLGVSCDDVARILRTRGDLEGALKLYRRALAISEDLARKFDTPDMVRSLCVSCMNVARVLEDQGDLAGALELYRRDLKLSEGLAKRFGTPDMRRDLGVSCANVARVLEDQGDLAGALKLHKRSLALFDELARKSGTPEALRDLSVACDSVAVLLEAQGELDWALKLFRRSLEFSEELVKRFGTPEMRRDLSVSCENVAGILEVKGDLAGALKLYERALAIREKLAGESGTPKALQDLSACYNNVAGVLKARRDLNGALELYKKALTIRRELARQSATPDVMTDILVSCNNIAWILEAQGDTSGALKLYREALAISEDLARRYGTPNMMRDLGITCVHTARVLSSQGDTAGATELYERALAIAQDLLQQRGSFQDLDFFALASYRLIEMPGLDPRRRCELSSQGLEAAKKLHAARPQKLYEDMVTLFSSYAEPGAE